MYLSRPPRCQAAAAPSTRYLVSCDSISESFGPGSLKLKRGGEKKKKKADRIREQQQSPLSLYGLCKKLRRFQSQAQFYVGKQVSCVNLCSLWSLQTLIWSLMFLKSPVWMLLAHRCTFFFTIWPEQNPQLLLAAADGGVRTHARLKQRHRHYCANGVFCLDLALELLNIEQICSHYADSSTISCSDAKELRYIRESTANRSSVHWHLIWLFIVEL